MKTVYIDVYFLINFTVDLLALHFASRFSKVPVGNIRLLLSAFLGGLFAVGSVFMPQSGWFFGILCVGFLIALCIVCAKGSRWGRKLKFGISFLLFEILIGGVVYFFFELFKKYFPTSEGGADIHNRGLLFLSVTVLLSMGIIKLLFILFDGARSERSVTVRIELLGEKIECTSLVDSGNLARDPMDSSPVIFLKRACAEGLFPEGIPELDGGTVPEKYKRYVRLIPINCGGVCKIVYGVRPDRVSVMLGKKEERINVTVAIDNEGGAYGGYEALMPVSALEGL